MAQMMVFVSHNHSDLAFCQVIVQALRDAGADVWLDESDLGAGHVRRVIMQELVKRPVFIVVLSKAALASQWVLDECDWAYDLQKDEPNRILLPVVAEPLERADFNAALHLYGLKRIEAPGMRPYPTQEAIHRLLHTLALTPADEALAPTALQPARRVADMVERGEALLRDERYEEALETFDQALVLSPDDPDIWYKRGDVLDQLYRVEEALVAYDRALALNPKDESVWFSKGLDLDYLERYDEALAAFDRALALDPNDPDYWAAKGSTFDNLLRYHDALAALDRAISLDATHLFAWRDKAAVLRTLGRTAEAQAAERRAKELGG